MRILFFFVHPSKYHLFKHSINILKKEGHQIDVTIVTKDILEDLIKFEGWEYENILPEGRRSKKLPPLFSTIYFSLKTLFRLYMYCRSKKYDLFVSDDLLVLLGRLKSTPSIFFTDDDLRVVKEIYPLFLFASKIVAPYCTDVGKFNYKKIGYTGYHELAYLNPKYFTPDFEKTKQFNPDGGKYFIIRLVSLTATHDHGKKGLANQEIRKLIELLEQYGKVFITSERSIPGEFEKYRIRINPSDITHALYYASMFIGDSQTMTSEAAILGTPALRFNDFVGKISSMEEKEQKYNITYGFKTNEFDKLILKVRELLQMNNLKEEWQKRVQKMLDECEDTNSVILRAIYANNVTGRS